MANKIANKTRYSKAKRWSDSKQIDSLTKGKQRFILDKLTELTIYKTIRLKIDTECAKFCVL